MTPVNLWLDTERGLPQFTVLGFTVCWADAWKQQRRGLEIVFLRRWRLVYVGFHPRVDDPAVGE